MAGKKFTSHAHIFESKKRNLSSNIQARITQDLRGLQTEKDRCVGVTFLTTYDSC